MIQRPQTWEQYEVVGLFWRSVSTQVDLIDSETRLHKSPSAALCVEDQDRMRNRKDEYVRLYAPAI